MVNGSDVSLPTTLSVYGINGWMKIIIFFDVFGLIYMRNYIYKTNIFNNNTLLKLKSSVQQFCRFHILDSQDGNRLLYNFLLIIVSVFKTTNITIIGTIEMEAIANINIVRADFSCYLINISTQIRKYFATVFLYSPNCIVWFIILCGVMISTTTLVGYLSIACLFLFFFQRKIK